MEILLEDTQMRRHRGEPTLTYLTVLKSVYITKVVIAFRDKLKEKLNRRFFQTVSVEIVIYYSTCAKLNNPNILKILGASTLHQ